MNELEKAKRYLLEENAAEKRLEEIYFRVQKGLKIKKYLEEQGWI
jgi:hypothetical protein